MNHLDHGRNNRNPKRKERETPYIDAILINYILQFGAIHHLN